MFKRKGKRLDVKTNVLETKSSQLSTKKKIVLSLLSLSLVLPMFEPITTLADETTTGGQTQQPSTGGQQPSTGGTPPATGGQQPQTTTPPADGGTQPGGTGGTTGGTGGGDGSNSNDRRAGLIQYGKSGVDGGNNKGQLAELTGQELKTVGVFMSNYYVPFSTQLGKVKDKEAEKEVKENIVKAMTETGAFSKEISETLAGAVMNVSADPKPLYFGQSTDGKDFKSVEGGKGKGRQATFYEFLDQISGYAYKKANKLPYPDLKDGVKAEDDNMVSVFKNSIWNFDKGKKTNEGVLYWGSKDKVDKDHIVFNWNPAVNEGGGQTASQTVMAEIYKYLDPEKSVGTAFLDYTEKERGGDGGKQPIAKMIEELKLEGKTIEEIYKRSMYDWTMWVDSFGNILVDTGVRQYVVVPAAMNPFVFKKQDTDKDGNKLDFGRAVPVNNLISLSLASQDQLVDKSKNPGKVTATFNVGDIYQHFSTKSNYKAGGLYKFPASGSIDWAEDWGRTSWGEAVLDGLSTQYAINGFGMKKKDGWGDWLKFGTAEWYSKTDLQYYEHGDLEDYKKFPYSFNSNRLDGNDIVYAPRSALNPSPSHFVIGDLVAFDTLGVGNMGLEAYKKHKGSADTILRTENGLWDKDGKPILDYKGITEGSAFGEKLEPKVNAVSNAKNQIARDYSANLYVAYVLGGMGGAEKVGFEIGFNRFPTYDGKTAMNGTQSKESKEEQKQANTDELMNMAYYFLHPTEGINYISRWAKTKIGGILVGWHNDMTGASNAQNTTGLTRYVGFSGFTTMPSLNDMQWTSWMTSTYLSWGVYLIIVMVVVMIFYIAIGEISFQRALLGVGIFSICLYLPPIAINSSVEFTNSISNSIYGKKFLYWGIMQQQTYAKKIDETAKAGKNGDSEEYTKGLMRLQEGSNGMYAGNTALGNGVTLKWMAPKKDNYLYQIQEELKEATDGKINNQSVLMGSILKRSLGGERYIDSNNAMYLYRTYNDIGNYSRFYYGNLMGDNVYDNGDKSHDIGDINASLGKVGMTRQLENYLQGTEKDSLTERKEKGFINDEADAIKGASTDKSKVKRIYAPLSSETLAKASSQNIAKVNVGDEVGVAKDNFNATVRNFNNHTESLQTQLKSSSSSENLASTSSFALYTESPFYYFSWFLYDNGMSSKAGSHDTFRTLMLKDNDSFFYNYKINKDSTGYGELKDYMDMGSMFTTVIPYLREVNKPVVQWSNIYGTKPYPDIPTTEDGASAYNDKNSEDYYKYWYNISLARLYNMYTPWVDAMYDTDYAKPENITYGGKAQTVIDPINPKSYTIRPMVFSESEMAYYGLKDYNLTTVEHKIIKIQRKTRNDLLQLMNYYNFDDNVLNQTASMIMTFNFNKEFSQENFITESFVQYPQSFELKNFSYDAYLRLILAQTTGEKLNATDDKTTIYDRVVEKSSILTGIFLVLGDIVAVYIIPVMKFLFLILVFALSVITIFVKAMRAEVSFKKVVWDSLAKPLVQFCSVTLAHSLIISFFMSNGVTSVTGDMSYSISLGDPVMTLVVLLLINLVAVVLYFFIIVSLVKNIITYGKLATTIVTSIVASAGTVATNMAGGVSNSVGNRVFGSDGGGSSPSASTSNASPQTRGSKNVQPELSVHEELRSRQINDTVYGDKEGKPKDNTDVQSMIDSGRRKVSENYSNDLNEYDLEEVRSRQTHERPRPEEQPQPSENKQTPSREQNTPKETDSQAELERKRKEADRVKDKYDVE